MSDEPLLGLATTRELFSELKTRMQMNGEHVVFLKLKSCIEMLDDEQLNYRTVDGS